MIIDTEAVSIDPIEELVRILGESDAGDLRPYDDAGAGTVDEPSRSLRLQQSTLRKLLRPRRSLPFLRARTSAPRSDLQRR